MQKNRKYIIRAFLLCFSFLILVSIATGQNPGTPTDPLISKSYIDYFLRFKSVVLPENTTLKPEAGAMIVIRSGQLRLEASSGKALIDLTSGREISGNTDLPHNHLLLVADSTGITLKARKLTTIMASCLNNEQQR